jgi:DnaJ domain
MTISPLIPYLPAFLSFFIYGVAIAGLFRYGKRGGRGCLFPLIFWYGFAILSVFLGLLVSVQDTTNQASFAVGVFIPFARSLWESEAVQAPLHFVRVTIDTIQHTAWQIGRLWQAWQTKRATSTNNTKHGQEGGAGGQPHGHTNQANHQSQQQNTHDQNQARQREQQQREAEARARREQAERERQDQQSASKPKPPPDTDDAPRDPVAVLGLKSGYTDEDLRTAYKREAGRTHPDKWIGKPEAIRQLMEAEYKAIQEAYRILQNRKP